MLKIKDNVDLKELENFGFNIEESSNSDSYVKRIEDNIHFEVIAIIVKGITRKIIIDSSRSYILHHLDLIYDLIKADLVEKTEE